MKRVISFFRESLDELKRVEWPKKDQTTRLTSYVVGVSLSLGLFLSGADYLFNKALSLIVTAAK